MTTLSPPSYFFDLATAQDAACAALILGNKRFEQLRGPKVEYRMSDGFVLTGRSDIRGWTFHLEKTPNFMASLAAEIYLKGLLVLRSGSHPRTHNLEKMFFSLSEDDRIALDGLVPRTDVSFTNRIGLVKSNFITLRYWTLDKSNDPETLAIFPLWMLKALRDYVNIVYPEGNSLRNFGNAFTEEERQHLSEIGYL